MRGWKGGGVLPCSAFPFFNSCFPHHLNLPLLQHNLFSFFLSYSPVLLLSCLWCCNSLPVLSSPELPVRRWGVQESIGVRNCQRHIPSLRSELLAGGTAAAKNSVYIWTRLRESEFLTVEAVAPRPQRDLCEWCLLLEQGASDYVAVLPLWLRLSWRVCQHRVSDVRGKKNSFDNLSSTNLGCWLKCKWNQDAIKNPTFYSQWNLVNLCLNWEIKQLI